MLGLAVPLGRDSGEGCIPQIDQRIIGSEEPQSAPPDRPAETASYIELGVLVEMGLNQSVVRRGSQRTAGEESEQRPMELVAPGGCDDVNDPAKRPPVLGFIPAGLDLHLLDEVVG